MARNDEKMQPCPHCGRKMHAYQLMQHAPLCLDNPAARAMYVAALSSDVAGEGITYSQYEAKAKADPSIPFAFTLRRMTGAKKWGDLLAEFGLTLPARARDLAPRGTRRTKAQRAEERAIAETAAEVAEVARILADDAARAHSLAVARVKPEKVLRVNGRECVRLELR
jgi:hypothetical protein